MSKTGLMNSVENRMSSEGHHYEHLIQEFWLLKASLFESPRRKKKLKLEQEVDPSVIFSIT